MASWRIDHYRQVFRYPTFRSFWLGFSFSVLGDMMTRVALTWFVYETTRSAEALGLLNLFYIGPVIFGGFVAGWLLDRFDRRKVMLIDNLLRGLAVSLIPMLHLSGQLALWHVYLVAAVYGSLMMIWAQTLRMQIIPEALRGRTFALLRTLMQGAGPLGGVLAGALLPIAGMSTMIGLSAIVVGTPGPIGYLVKDLRQT